jgi:hypothetical protein
MTARKPLMICRATWILALPAVESKKVYSAHVAIDRFTGQVLDKQIEVANANAAAAQLGARTRTGLEYVHSCMTSVFSGTLPFSFRSN